MKNYVYPVRWLGSEFGGANSYHDVMRNEEDFRKSLQWELHTAIRERSFGFTNGSGVGSAWLGLLVDLPVSKIDIIKRDDGYSLRYANGLKMIFRELHDTESSGYGYRGNDDGDKTIYRYTKQFIRHDRTFPVKPHLTQRVVTRWGGYSEGLGYLKFVGIVIRHNANEKQVSLATKLAEEFKIPYLGKLRSFRPGKYMTY